MFRLLKPISLNKTVLKIFINYFSCCNVILYLSKYLYRLQKFIYSKIYLENNFKSFKKKDFKAPKEI